MPISDKRLAANRVNSKKSTGPKTEAGKAKVAANALKHGLNARQNIVLPHQREAYDTLAHDLRAEVQPLGALELDTFQQLLQAAWLLRRTDLFEAALFHPRAGVNRLLLHVERLTRLRGALERSYQRAYRRLRELQSTRAAEETLSTQSQLAHSATTPLAALPRQKKQSHFFPERLYGEYVRAFSNPGTNSKFPLRTLLTAARVVAGHPTLRPNPPGTVTTHPTTAPSFSSPMEELADTPRL
jgi:hypothetical protein